MECQSFRLTLGEPATVEQVGSQAFMVKVWRQGPDGWMIDEPTAEPTTDRVTVIIDTLGLFGAGVELE